MTVPALVPCDGDGPFCPPSCPGHAPPKPPDCAACSDSGVLPYDPSRPGVTVGCREAGCKAAARRSEGIAHDKFGCPNPSTCTVCPDGSDLEPW